MEIVAPVPAEDPFFVHENVAPVALASVAHVPIKRVPITASPKRNFQKFGFLVMGLILSVANSLSNESGRVG